MRTLAKKLVLIALILLNTTLNPSGISAQEAEVPGELKLHPQALGPTGIYDLKALDNSLNGEDVKMAVICRSMTSIDGTYQNDYRPAVSHNCFSTSLFDFHDDNKLPWGISSHATSICSILFGEDEYAYHPEVGRFYYQGVVPKANAGIYEFWNFVKYNVSFQIPPDADVMTASFGDQFDDWWTRGIESLADRYGIVLVAGIGNGTESSDSVLYPAAGSNAIGVGVIDSLNSEDLLIQLENFALAYPEHSSTGPTIEGRCKPDIVAPGNCLVAGVEEPNKYEPSGNWSSFSTPVVAGAAGLLVQKAKQEDSLSLAISPYGGNCVIKALLLNSATKLPFWHKGKLTTEDDHTAPLDHIQGAGMLNALGAFSTLVAGRNIPGEVAKIGWDLNQLKNNKTSSNFYQFSIDDPSSQYITATLCWNRHYEKKYPFDPLNEKNSDLRLELWAIDINNPDNSYLLDYSDSTIDNVEHIYVKADPNFTDYEIVLSINNTSYENPDNTQRYGLAWNVTYEQEDDSNFWYDLNADGAVDIADMTILFDNQENSLKSTEDYLLGDIDLDGQIDNKDFVELLDNLDNKDIDYSQTTTNVETENKDLNLVSLTN